MPRPETVEDGRDRDVPLWRLYLLRAMFAVFVVGGFVVHVPWMTDDPDLTRRGMLDSMLAGLWVLSFLGLRYPLAMLPVFLFEFVWKTIWLLAFGLPQWMAGRADPQLGEDLVMIGLGPLAFGLIVPWGYVFRTYVAKAGPPWRPGPASPGLWTRGGHEASLARLYVMRAIALVFIVGGFSNYLPGLLDPDPTARGMLISMLGGLWVLAYVALRHPLLMLPIFLYELVWKSIWLLAFGLPQWSAGRVDPQLSKDLFEIGLFPLVFALIIPWGYFWRHFVRAPADGWR
jgi:hypothetical protein